MVHSGMSSEDDNEEEDIAALLLNLEGVAERSRNADLNGLMDDDDDDDDAAMLATAQLTATGLSSVLLKAISRRGYREPTPIQRNTIPLILQGRDVVGMARTGSGKTAAFVIPMLEKLRAHSAKVGIRAIVLSPSRELALQTIKVVKEMGKGTDLRSVLLVGGDSLETQFSLITANPDILIATPGRFLHLLVEMHLNLDTVQYIVFDEADRLFEMGFQLQLTEICHKLPPSRQTLLFSATLPSSLVEFAKAGLLDPVLVRLDAESKISSELESAFFSVKPGEKEAALLYILQNLIKLPNATSLCASSKESDTPAAKLKKKYLPHEVSKNATLIFTSTKHHVEYLTKLLQRAGYAVSYVYGSLHQLARRENIAKFSHGETNVLIVTDLAARGIDIPLLSNVINYDFPSQPKVFIHRVGRTARAGQRGWAYSLITPRDAPYLVDLILFLGRPLVTKDTLQNTPDYTSSAVLGTLSRDLLEMLQELVTKLTNEDVDLSSAKHVAQKGEALYVKTRPSASIASVKRAKKLVNSPGWTSLHPLCELAVADSQSKARSAILERVSDFRPRETVFEIGKRGAKGGGEAAIIMRHRRKRIIPLSKHHVSEATDIHEETDKDTYKDKSVYMSHLAPREIAETLGYSLSGNMGTQSFATASVGAVLNLDNDEGTRGLGVPSKAKGMRWDKKKKRFINRVNDEDGSRGPKLIRGESGQKIPATFQAGRYEAWQKAHKTSLHTGADEKERQSGFNAVASHKFRHTKTQAPKQPDKYRDDYYKKAKAAKEQAAVQQSSKASLELRSIDQISKMRKEKAKRRAKNDRRVAIRRKKR